MLNPMMGETNLVLTRANARSGTRARAKHQTGTPRLSVRVTESCVEAAAN
jgi:hypothetical protein